MKHNLVSRIANFSLWSFSEYQRIKDLSYEQQCLSPLNDIYPGIIDKYNMGLSFLEIISKDKAEDTLERLYKFESIINSI